jgi:hypothetical protein
MHQLTDNFAERLFLLLVSLRPECSEIKCEYICSATLPT